MQQYKIEAILQCVTNAREEIEAAFKRALDDFGALQLDNARHGNWSEVPQNLRPRAPGLLVKFRLEDGIVLVAVPEYATVLPSWIHNPDATGSSRLATLAQELSILLFPPEWKVLSAEATATTNLEVAYESFNLHSDSQFLAIPLGTAKEKNEIIIGLATGRSSESGSAPPDRPAARGSDRLRTASESKGRPPSLQDPRSRGILPLLTNSLLRIRLPLEVTLATTRKPLLELLQLCPGAIIQFEKSCDEPLELSINGHVIAKGEAVKVGDKFGLRILEMTPPPERYIVLGPRKAGQGISQHQ
ncbi:MAG: FliM/FliN family flagellar motor switch protein [Thermogutta sp.]